jgi:DUF1680 family protein
MREKDWACDALYQTTETVQEAGAVLEDKKIVLIPYYAWANRKTGEMTVWMNQQPRPEGRGMLVLIRMDFMRV